jgi:hypothetical protein
MILRDRPPLRRSRFRPMALSLSLHVHRDGGRFCRRSLQGTLAIGKPRQASVLRRNLEPFLTSGSSDCLLDIVHPVTGQIFRYLSAEHF